MYLFSLKSVLMINLKLSSFSKGKSIPFLVHCVHRALSQDVDDFFHIFGVNCNCGQHCDYILLYHGSISRSYCGFSIIQ